MKGYELRTVDGLRAIVKKKTNKVVENFGRAIPRGLINQRLRELNAEAKNATTGK
jgi:hypothetical protein